MGHLSIRQTSENGLSLIDELMIFAKMVELLVLRKIGSYWAASKEVEKPSDVRFKIGRYDDILRQKVRV